MVESLSPPRPKDVVTVAAGSHDVKIAVAIDIARGCYDLVAASSAVYLSGHETRLPTVLQPSQLAMANRRAAGRIYDVEISVLIKISMFFKFFD